MAWTWVSPDLELIKKIPDHVEEPYNANGMKAERGADRGPAVAVRAERQD